MKPDYKNWIPKGMLVSLIAGTVLSLALLLVFGIFGIGVGGKLRVVLGVVFGIAFVVCAKCTQWCVYAYRSFSYDGERNTDKGKAENKKSVVKYAKWYTPEKEAKYPTSFKVDFIGQPYEGACYYRITRCPICSYARNLGVSELMPLFCELDEVMITLQHGVLHRKQTLANGGEYCDYFITGDKERP